MMSRLHTVKVRLSGIVHMSNNEVKPPNDISCYIYFSYWQYNTFFCSVLFFYFYPAWHPTNWQTIKHITGVRQNFSEKKTHKKPT